MSIIKVKDWQGNIQDIALMRGPVGPTGSTGSEGPVGPTGPAGSSGSKLYLHQVSFKDINFYTFNIMFKSTQSTAFTAPTLINGHNKAVGANGYVSDGTDYHIVIITDDWGSQDFGYTMEGISSTESWIDTSEEFTDYVTEV